VGDYFKCPEKVEERGKGVGLVDLPKGCLIPVRDPGPGLYEHRHAPTARTDTHADGRNKITCLSARPAGTTGVELSAATRCRKEKQEITEKKASSRSSK